MIIVSATAACAAVALIVLYFFVDPAASRWMPKCFFRELTGWSCPGCGFQRAIHALLHGRVAEAWGYNPFIFIIIPMAVALGVIEWRRESLPRLYALVYRPVTFVVIIFIIAGWTVARNILNI